jgi:hypothetical protein
MLHSEDTVTDERCTQELVEMATPLPWTRTIAMGITTLAFLLALFTIIPAFMGTEEGATSVVHPVVRVYSMSAQTFWSRSSAQYLNSIHKRRLSS